MKDFSALEAASPSKKIAFEGELKCERNLDEGPTMRDSRAQAAENRQAVISVASRLFGEHGLDGISLKDLMRAPA